MLEGLDRLDWGQLSHAYGAAGDVPRLLRALASPDVETREEAVHEFFGSIWHQGTVYSATAAAVPFLIELLQACPVSPRVEILLLLQSIAGGSSYLDVHQRHRDFYYEERHTPEYQAQLERELEWVRAARAAVLAGTPVYQDRLTDPDPAVRAMVPYLLASCAERAAEIEPTLRWRLDLETEPGPRTSIVTALTALWRQAAGGEGNPVPLADERCQILAGLMRAPTESPAVRLAAAMGLARLADDAYQEEADAVFWRAAGPAGPVLRELPWWDGAGPLSAVSAALRNQPERRLELLLAMLRHHEAGLRGEAVWELEEVCREHRSAPRVVVPARVPLMTDPDPEVRRCAARALPTLGAARQMAVEPLQALREHADRQVRELARESLARVREPQEKHHAGYWLERWRPKALRQRSIPELAAILQVKGKARGVSASFECAEAAACLELRGPAAAAALPVLRQALEHELHWVRVFAARALWEITGEAAAVVPLLTRELAGHPADYVILDCLGEMGPQARTAVPRLQEMVKGEERVLRSGSLDEWVDEDEGLRAAAGEALARILQGVQR